MPWRHNPRPVNEEIPWRVWNIRPFPLSQRSPQDYVMSQLNPVDSSNIFHGCLISSIPCAFNRLLKYFPTCLKNLKNVPVNHFWSLTYGSIWVQDFVGSCFKTVYFYKVLSILFQYQCTRNYLSFVFW